MEKVNKAFTVTVTDCMTCPYADDFVEECMHEEAHVDLVVDHDEIPDLCPVLKLEKEAKLRKQENDFMKEVKTGAWTDDVKTIKTPLRWKK